MGKKIEDFVPKQLLIEISKHISNIYEEKQTESWESSRSDEDALCGHFFGAMIKNETKFSDDLSWKINYKKTRGRGKKNPETAIGADGIYTFELKNKNGEIIFQKAFLFQAKMDKSFNENTTLYQAKKMDSITQTGSVIIVFSEKEFKVIKTSDYLQSTSKYPYESFDKYVNDEFLKCLHGEQNMNYDINEEKLTILDDNNIVKKEVQSSLKSELKITVSRKK